MADRTYFLVEPGSPVLGVINSAVVLQQAHRDALEAFAADFGVQQWYVTTNWQVYLLGLAFNGEPPRGWRENKKKGYSKPDLRTPEGRAIAQRMRALPEGVSAAKFAAMLDNLPRDEGQSYSAWEGCGISWTVYEKLGEQYVLSVPTACKVSPPGCRELKMSEYWQIKEEAEKAVPA